MWNVRSLVVAEVMLIMFRFFCMPVST